MTRWARIVLTALAAIVGGWAGLIAVGGGVAGFAWVFLFGDDPWPRWSEIAIPVVALAGCLAGALALGLAAWRFSGNARS